MATSKSIAIDIPNIAKSIRLNHDTHNSIIALINSIQEANNRSSMAEFRTKLEVIDRAYYTYSAKLLSAEDALKEALIKSGVQFEVPIILSQIDTLTAFFMEVFLDSQPLFPVVSPTGKEHEAAQLEALIDDHAVRGRWPRQLLLFLNNAAKYNFAPLVVEWSPIGRLTISDLITSSSTSTPPTIKGSQEKINRIKALDPYNTLWDIHTEPSDIAEEGDYFGWNEVISRTKLKKLISVLTRAGGENIFNVKEAFETSTTGAEQWSFYHEKPQVSNYVAPISQSHGELDWVKWATLSNVTNRPIDYRNSYLLSHLYARIIPSDHNLAAPEENTPQVWKFIAVNNSTLISAKKIISPLDMIPGLIGQPQEDGFSIQSRSVGEQGISSQNIISELINIRLNGSRRSLSDRAIYDPTMFDPADINSVVPAAKIPSKHSLRGVDIRQHYLQIPFDSNGTTGAMQDVQTMLQLSEFLGSLNSARQGQFRKGNRTRGEFDTILNNSELRSRRAALMLEYQVFVPLRELIKANIFTNVTTQDILNQTTGDIIKIDPKELRTALLSFKLADGHTSREQLANAPALTQALQAVVTVPELQQQYSVQALFEKLMSVLGVSDITRLRRQLQQQAAPAPGGPQNAPSG